MKTLHLIIGILLFTQLAHGQQKSTKPLTAFQQVYKLGSKVKAEDVFTVVENWVNTNAALFTSLSAPLPTDVKQKNKDATEREFNNSKPLQVTDPSAYRIQALGLVKYFGGTTTSIRMMYVKYDIAIEVKAGEAIFSLSNVRYFHFDSKSFTESGIFSFDGGKPCDHSGTLDDLYACQKNPEEFSALAEFFNKTVKAQEEAFNKELKDKKLLYTAPATATKSGTPKKATSKTSAGSKSSSSTKATGAGK